LFDKAPDVLTKVNAERNVLGIHKYIVRPVPTL
jgi:hypothetical protein